LYRENEKKKEMQKEAQKLREEQIIEKELQECTFSPRRDDSNGSRMSGDLQFNRNANIRSPERFYKDMMTFKQKKETKLSNARSFLDQEAKENSRKTVSRERKNKIQQEQYDKKLSQDKLRKISPRIKTDI